MPYIHTYIVNRKELEAQYLRYTMLLHYGIEPPELPLIWNEFGIKFSIANALDYNKSSVIKSFLIGYPT